MHEVSPYDGVNLLKSLNCGEIGLAQGPALRCFFSHQGAKQYLPKRNTSGALTDRLDPRRNRLKKHHCQGKTTAKIEFVEGEKLGRTARKTNIPLRRFQWGDIKVILGKDFSFHRSFIQAWGQMWFCSLKIEENNLDRAEVPCEKEYNQTYEWKIHNTRAFIVIVVREVSSPGISQSRLAVRHFLLSRYRGCL